jgi:hypothetical protein
MQETVYKWLECNILDELDNHDVVVEVKLQDDSSATITVHPTLIVNKNKQGYVKVEYLAGSPSDKKGRSKGLTSIKLPRPSMQHGHNIVVKSKLVKDEI